MIGSLDGEVASPGQDGAVPAAAASVQCRALRVLMLADPEEKATACAALANDPGVIAHPLPIEAVRIPGRPSRPQLVAPRDLKKRGLGSWAGRVALLHAVAHIEFNAINLALDAVYRFSGMPDDYYTDWLSVAVDEARHYRLLSDRLEQLGACYGDLPAHNGLWESAVATAHSVLERMALVPRVLEARGLDVSPGMIERLRAVNDGASAAILEVILDEEVRHVAIGTRWFHFACERAKVDPGPTFLALVERHMKGAIKGPLNHAARRAAGFESSELAALENWS